MKFQIKDKASINELRYDAERSEKCYSMAPYIEYDSETKILTKEYLGFGEKIQLFTNNIHETCFKKNKQSSLKLDALITKACYAQALRIEMKQLGINASLHREKSNVKKRTHIYNVLLASAECKKTHTLTFKSDADMAIFLFYFPQLIREDLFNESRRFAYEIINIQPFSGPVSGQIFTLNVP